MSGLFGNTKGLPSNGQRAFGLQSTRANTNQQARPVPLLYGQQRFSVTFISDCFDIDAQPVNQSVGKQQQQVGTNYFASFAGLVCMGPVDGIYDLFLNGQPVFTQVSYLVAISLTASGSTGNLFMTATFQTAGPHGQKVGNVLIVLGADQPEYNGEITVTAVPSPTQFQYQITPTDATTATASQSGQITAQERLKPVLRNADNPDFADITIPGYGTMTIYWGTETQTQDLYLSSVSGVIHPNYLGQCYIVFQQLYFGFNQTNVPNVEVVVARAPLPDWASLGSGFIQNDANPAYIIGDMFQNPRAGLALTQIDTVGLDAAAVQFNNEDFGVSQALTRQQDLRSILKSLCETIDALPLLNAEWLLSMLPIRPLAQADLPAAITDAELSDLPNFTPSDWSTSYTHTKVMFNDASLAFEDNMAEWRDTGARNVIQNPDTLTLDRRWITRADLAQAIANAAGQMSAIPITTGKLKLRYDDARFAQLAPGALFQINSNFRSTSALVFRVMSRNVPKPDQPEYEIEFQTDYSYLYTAIISGIVAAEPQPQSHGSQEGDDDAPPLAPIPFNTRLRLIELPPGLCDGVPSVAAVVARNATGITSFSLWLKKNYAWSGNAPATFSFLQTQTGFAMHGATLADYPSTTRMIDLELGVPVLFDGPDTSLDPITAFDALSNNVLGFIDDEILSLAGWTLLSQATYQLNFIRGRFGTPIEDHAPGAQLLLVSRANQPIISQPAFQPNNTVAIKVGLGSQDVSNATELDLLLAGLAWRVPPPCALAVNGRGINAIFPGGPAQITMNWGLPDAGGLLPRFDLVKLATRLQFVVGGNVIYQTDVPWPATSAQFVFSALNGGVDTNFTLRAQTVCTMPWKAICSGRSNSLIVTKYP